jgi:protein-S-isoprenylcysteine O-methyltransferase Ste14
MTSPDATPERRVTVLGAIVAFLAMPGIVAFAVPLALAQLTPHPGGFARAAFLELGLGAVILLFCVRQFYLDGRGTLAPWSPPVTLVRNGLYKWSRNPMYIGVLLIVSGWALGFQSSAIWIYVAALAIGFHLRVVLGEEPSLARAHGDEWMAYRKRVPRWIF